MDRRFFIKTTGAFVIAGGAIARTIVNVLAGKGWCRSDPDVEIGGHRLRIKLAVEGDLDPNTGLIIGYTPVVVLNIGYPPNLPQPTVVDVSDNGLGSGYQFNFVPDTRVRTAADGAYEFWVSATLPEYVASDGRHGRYQLTAEAITGPRVGELSEVAVGYTTGGDTRRIRGWV